MWLSSHATQYMTEASSTAGAQQLAAGAAAAGLRVALPVAGTHAGNRSRGFMRAVQRHCVIPSEAVLLPVKKSKHAPEVTQACSQPA